MYLSRSLMTKKETKEDVSHLGLPEPAVLKVFSVARTQIIQQKHQCQAHAQACCGHHVINLHHQ